MRLQRIAHSTHSSSRGRVAVGTEDGRSHEHDLPPSFRMTITCKGWKGIVKYKTTPDFSHPTKTQQLSSLYIPRLNSAQQVSASNHESLHFVTSFGDTLLLVERGRPKQPFLQQEQYLRVKIYYRPGNCIAYCIRDNTNFRKIINVHVRINTFTKIHVL